MKQKDVMTLLKAAVSPSANWFLASAQLFLLQHVDYDEKFLDRNLVVLISSLIHSR
jgi:hypothetical protein